MSDVSENLQSKEILTKPLEVVIKPDGALDFVNQTELVASARLIMRMKLAPEHLMKDGIEALMSAMMFCKQFNLPIKAMNEMAYIKGKLTCYGSLVTTLAERHHEYGEFEEFFLDETCEVICAKNKNLKSPVWAAVYRAKRKNSGVWNEYKFTMDDAKSAGLLSNPTWQKYPADMLMHKSRSRALKANYASALNGADYHEDIAYEAQPPSLAKEMNDKFLNDEVQVERQV